VFLMTTAKKMKKKIMCVVGTRPEFIRMAPVIEEILGHPDFELQLLHTGQHYSYEMKKVFFDELGIPEPLINLGVGSGTHLYQLTQIMSRMGDVLEKFRPHLVVVFGDTNSSLGAALASVKTHVPLVHIEAGCRSYDLRMAEEVNRRLIDHCADLLFPVSDHCLQILQEEQVPGSSYQCGDPLYDIFIKNLEKAMNKSKILEKLGLVGKPFGVVTLHRAENVDDPETLGTIILALGGIANFPLIFPIHPRTKKRVGELALWEGLKIGLVRFIPPLSYWDFLALMCNAHVIITDSGGVQKEALFAGIPCVTLRESTEWVETVEMGANVLIDPRGEDVARRLQEAVDGCSKLKDDLRFKNNPYGDGKASRRIVETLLQIDL